MAYQKSEVEVIVREFIEKLKRKISVEQIILFGSYAYGRTNKFSDIDIAVVSKEFKKMDDIKRLMFLSNVARAIRPKCPIDIEALGFTKEEIEKADYFEIGGEIRENGRVIYSAKQRKWGQVSTFHKINF